MLENLMILLDDEKHESTATIANLPSNEDVLKSLSAHAHPAQVVSVPSTPVIDKTNTMCAVVWEDENDSYSWFLGYIKEQVNDMFIVDHLARAVKNSHSKWKYPSQEDVQQVDMDQIVDCDIEGEWDMEADSRKRFFNLHNGKTISCAFNKHISGL